MDERLKQRLVGAAVLVLAAVVFVPKLLDQGGGAPEQPPHIISLQPSEATVTPVVPLHGNATAAAPAPTAPARPVAAEEKPPAKAAAAPAAAESSPTGPGPTELGPTQLNPTGLGPTGLNVKPSFTVQLGSFSKADNARGLRDKLVARGYTVVVTSSGSVTRVYVGPQSSRAEAEKVLKKLLADTNLKGIVVNFSG